MEKGKLHENIKIPNYNQFLKFSDLKKDFFLCLDIRNTAVIFLFPLKSPNSGHEIFYYLFGNIKYLINFFPIKRASEISSDLLLQMKFIVS